jgi:hypothetical protein
LLCRVTAPDHRRLFERVRVFDDFFAVLLTVTIASRIICSHTAEEIVGIFCDVRVLTANYRCSPSM